MTLRAPFPVTFFAAVMYNPQYVSNPDDIISEIWGKTTLRSNTFKFGHTDYYDDEMGTDLLKFFVALDVSTDPADLVDYKLAAIDKEKVYANGHNRTINIDPGYLAVEKVVVASTKNFTHRIYLGRGIYGDLQLMRQKGVYTPMPWTYADYASAEAADFFNRLYKLVSMRNL